MRRPDQQPSLDPRSVAITAAKLDWGDFRFFSRFTAQRLSERARIYLGFANRAVAVPFVSRLAWRRLDSRQEARLPQSGQKWSRPSGV